MNSSIPGARELPPTYLHGDYLILFTANQVDTTLHLPDQPINAN
jgi:hypothetical protein